MHRIRTVIMILVLLLLGGCGAKPESIPFSGSSVPETNAVTVETADKSSEEDSFPQVAIKESSDSSKEEISETEVKEEPIVEAAESIPAGSPGDDHEGSSSQPVNSQAENSEPKSDSEPEQKPQQSDPEPAAMESEAKQEPEDSLPEEWSPEPEPEPTEEQASEPEPVQGPVSEPEPDFDIGYWIGYAKSVAAEKGLNLDPSAVDCWDNPITANPDCIYLERDISARLSRYAGDEDITDVWIWYESTGPNKYLIYIGYA